MTTPQQLAIDALWIGQSITAGVEVTYRRAGRPAVTVTAVPGRTITETFDGDGFAQQTKMADWIVKASALGFTPTGGDRIEWGNRRFEVVSGRNESNYEYIGSHRVLIRIHTQEVSRV